MSGYHKIYNPSMLWLIERAPTLQLLEDLMRKAVQLKGASMQTRKQWADACERRQFILERNPPTFEKIGIGEVFTAEELADPRLKMSVEDVIQQVLDNRHFKCAEDGTLEVVGMGGVMPLDKYFNEAEFVPKDGYRPVERFYVDLEGKRRDNQQVSVE